MRETEQVQVAMWKTSKVQKLLWVTETWKRKEINWNAENFMQLKTIIGYCHCIVELLRNLGKLFLSAVLIC